MIAFPRRNNNKCAILVSIIVQWKNILWKNKMAQKYLSNYKKWPGLEWSIEEVNFMEDRAKDGVSI